ncbi:MAG: sulfite exporter TauE/SafE family protein, partial [Gammaproteobacteria bacterium]
MTALAPTVLAMFLAGLLGSGHCMGMCGGIATALGALPGERPVWLQALLFNGGRVLGYGLLGLAAGGLSNLLGSGMLPAGLAWLRLAAATLLVLLGAQLLFQRGLLAPLERMGGRLWKHIAPLAGRALGHDHGGAALGVGMLWALLPCGLVYTALAASLTTGDPAAGAATMLAFGLGTLPAMLAATAGGNVLTRLLRRARIR